MSESSPSRLAWPMHPGITTTHLEAASRSEILDRVRPQAIYNSSRPQACRALAYDSARPQAHPKKTQEGASPQAHAGARRRPQAEGVWGRGEEGSNPPVHREREGRGAIPTPYMHPIPTFLYS